MMSYVGSLGFVMKGSGLQQALDNIYGSNTVEHMFTGKATTRALRGHFLTESALQTKLLRSLLPAHLTLCINESNDADVPKEKIGPNEEYVHQDSQHENQRPMLDDKRYSFQLENEQVEELSTLVKSVEKEPAKTVDLASNSSVLRHLNEKLLQYMKELCNSSRTAKLWIQYLRYVEILKLFIRAERRGNWNLHLEAVN